MDAFEEHEVNDLGLSIENLDEIGIDTPHAPLYFEVESDEKLKLNNDSQLFATSVDEKVSDIDDLNVGDENGFGDAVNCNNFCADEVNGEAGEQLDEDRALTDGELHSASDFAGGNDVSEKPQCSEENVGIRCDVPNVEKEITGDKGVKSQEIENDQIGDTDGTDKSKNIGGDQTTDPREGNDANVVDGSKNGSSSENVVDVKGAISDDEVGNSGEVPKHKPNEIVEGKIDVHHTEHGEVKNGNGESQIDDVEQNIICQQVGNSTGTDSVETGKDVFLASNQESIINGGKKSVNEEEEKEMNEGTKFIQQQQQQHESVVSSTPNKVLPKEPFNQNDKRFDEDVDAYESPIPPTTPEGFSSVKRGNNGTLNSEVSSTDMNDTDEMLRDHYRILPLPNSPWHSLREEDFSKGGTPSSLDRKNYTSLIDSDREPSFSGSFPSGNGLKDYERDLSFGISSVPKKEDGDGQYTSLVAHSKREADARRDVLLKPCYVISIGVGHVDFRKPSKRGSKTADFFRSLTSSNDNQLESMLIAWKIS